MDHVKSWNRGLRRSLDGDRLCWYYLIMLHRSIYTGTALYTFRLPNSPCSYRPVLPIYQHNKLDNNSSLIWYSMIHWCEQSRIGMSQKGNSQPKLHSHLHPHPLSYIQLFRNVNVSINMFCDKFHLSLSLIVIREDSLQDIPEVEIESNWDQIVDK